jgi:hypothetical protein
MGTEMFELKKWASLFSLSMGYKLIFIAIQQLEYIIFISVTIQSYTQPLCNAGSININEDITAY